MDQNNMLSSALCQEKFIQVCQKPVTVSVEMPRTKREPTPSEIRRARELAERLGQRIDAYNAESPQGMRVKISDTVSRILDNDPSRPRKSNATRSRPTLDPSVFTLQAIAEQCHTTVGELLGEESFTPEDREFLGTVASWITRKLDGRDSALPRNSSNDTPVIFGGSKRRSEDDGTRRTRRDRENVHDDSGMGAKDDGEK